ncbi:MAG: Holliday junction branch migration protein RuvA [Kofleriaceae bacterium]
MIARLDGTLVREDDQVIVDCNGVGYEVICSNYTLAALPAAGDKITLRIFTQVRETDITLYGFYEHSERSLFDLLITVKNVGPSTAIAMLSGASPRDIAALIARQDVPGLVRIKGIGKKTAELLVVELHEKCELLVLTWNASGGVRPAASIYPPAVPARGKPGRHPMLEEVASAMSGMGWRPAEADAAVADLVVEDGASIESLLRQALRKMPR